MQLSDINPFLRYAELQPSVLSQAPHSCSYDYRIFYILSGNTHIVLEKSTLSVKEGSIVYICPGMPYYFEEKVKIIVLNFDMTRNHSSIKHSLHPSHIDSFDPSKITETNPPAELEHILVLENAFSLEPLLQECITNYLFPSVLSDAITSSIIKRLLCHLVTPHSSSETQSSALAHDIMLYIKKNYDKNLSNTEIANKFKYHPYHLNKIFKDSMGITIHQAIIYERINIAKKLLTTTDLSIEAIAFEIGFTERAQFCTTFKKHTRMTPGNYRKSKLF